MLPQEIENIERLRSEIDAALIRLFHAKRDGYTFCDFGDKLKQLFTSQKVHEYSSEKIRTYLAVFTDLFEPVSYIVSTIKSIDKEKRQVVREVYEHYVKRVGIEQRKDNVTQYDDSNHQLLDILKVGHQLSIPKTKYSWYLEGADITANDDATVKQWAFETGFKDLFKANGYTDFDHSITFERFIGWIDQQEEGGEVDTLRLLFDAEKPGYNVCLYLLKELDVVDANDAFNPKIKAAELLGLAVALKESSHNFLQGQPSDDEVLLALQMHLKAPFKSSKRRGKGFVWIRDQAKQLINSYMKKARAT